MTRNELCSNVAQKLHWQKEHVKRAVTAILDQIKGELAAGRPVIIRGFATFSVVHKKARSGRNPVTGEPALVTRRKVVRFKASKKFKEMVNSNKRPVIILKGETFTQEDIKVRIQEIDNVMEFGKKPLSGGGGC